MSQENSFLDEVSNGPLSAQTRAYIGQRAKNAFYDFVIDRFRASGLSQAALARRIGGRTDSLNRLLRNPGNWRLETGAVLLAGICGEELLPCAEPFAGRAPRNHNQFDQLSDDPLPNAGESSVTAGSAELVLHG